MSTSIEVMRPPLWTNFTPKGWFTFVDEYRNYKSLGGAISLGRCVSAKCKMQAKLEFDFENWAAPEKAKIAHVESKTKKTPKKSSSEAKTEDVDDEESFEDKVISTISSHFAPVSMAAAQSMFRELRMSSATMNDLRTFNYNFVLLETQCQEVLPPRRLLLKFYVDGLKPQHIKEHVKYSDCATWADARKEATKLMREYEQLSYVTAPAAARTQPVAPPREVRPAQKSRPHDSAKDAKRAPGSFLCYSCNQPGHISKFCPSRTDTAAIHVPMKNEIEQEVSDPEVSWPVVDEVAAAVQIADRATEAPRTKTTARRSAKSDSDEERERARHRAPRKERNSKYLGSQNSPVRRRTRDHTDPVGLVRPNPFEQLRDSEWWPVVG